MNTLIREKANVARLRDLYEKESDPLIKESIHFRLAEARLWHDVAERGVLTPELIEPLKANIEKILSKPYRRVKYAVIAITVAVILAIVCCGCGTLKGMSNDGAWILQTVADNIRTEK